MSSTAAEIINRSAEIQSLARILAGEEKMASLLRKVVAALEPLLPTLKEAIGSEQEKICWEELLRSLEVAGYDVFAFEPFGPVAVPRPEHAAAYCTHGQPINELCEECNQ